MPQHPAGHVFYRQMEHDYPVITHGEGALLFDENGRSYLDGSGGPLVVNVGHGVEQVAQAMAQQAAAVAYVHGSLFTTAALERYSERLAGHVPLAEARFYYLTSGSEAVEAAIKYARQLQVARGERERHLIISRWGSYHGATLGTLALSGKPAMRQLYLPMLRDMPHIEPPYCYRCPFGASYPACDLACARQLERAIEHHGAGQVAAFIGEPVGGATLGGIVPPAGYWALIREICDRHGLLLISDEVLTGFGRTGDWFGCQRLGFRPDLMAMAKGIAGGYFPLAALAARGADVELMRRAHGNFDHGGTYSHHAVGLAAAGVVMDLLENTRLVERAAELGDYLGQQLCEKLAGLPAVGDVRGIGMMWGVEFVSDRASKTPYPAAVHYSARVCSACRGQGVLLYPGHGGVDGVRGDHLMVAPPFVASREQIDTIVTTLAEAVRKISAAL